LLHKKNAPLLLNSPWGLKQTISLPQKGSAAGIYVNLAIPQNFLDLFAPWRIWHFPVLNNRIANRLAVVPGRCPPGTVNQLFDSYMIYPAILILSDTAAQLDTS
jgi:hypothetical protein